MVAQVDWMSSLKSRNSIVGTPTTVGRNSETATGKVKKRRGRDDRNHQFDGAGPKKCAFSGHRVRFTFRPESMPEANFQPYTHRFAAAWECGLLGPPTGLISHKCVPSVQSDGGRLAAGIGSSAQNDFAFTLPVFRLDSPLPAKCIRRNGPSTCHRYPLSTRSSATIS
jgi:hypothetical protein